MSEKRIQEEDSAENLFTKGKDPEAEEAFADELGESICRVLVSYSEIYNRLGVCGFWADPREDHYNTGIEITNGLASILPCVPDPVRHKSSIRCAAELEFAAQTYGDNMDEWPKEALAGFAEDKNRVFTFYLSRIRKFKAEFAMGILLSLPDWGASIHLAYEEALGPFAMGQLLPDWPRDPEKLTIQVAEYLSKWLLEPECWRACRDRRLELFVSYFGEFIA